METREEKIRRMEDASRKADQAAAELLHNSLAVLQDHLDRLDELKPSTVDEATYQALISAVAKATDRNESLAALANRIRALGAGAVELTKTLASAAKDLA